MINTYANEPSEQNPSDSKRGFLKSFGCYGFIFLSALLLASCADRDDLAPVEEPKWRSVGQKATRYKVVQGDTLYSIAFRYDLDYRQMAEFNNLKSPFTLKIGQVLRLKGQASSIGRRLVAPYYSLHARLKPSVLPQKPQIAPSNPSPTYSTIPSNSNSKWSWPAKGRVVESFSPQRGIKGINIEGKKGDKVFAAASGVVAYAGNGLAGYGNLIIIKHDNQFLTAYGNNLQNRVREGQAIQKGQVIADMGVVNRKYWGVHFEIRQLGKPVNPLGGFLK